MLINYRYKFDVVYPIGLGATIYVIGNEYFSVLSMFSGTKELLEK
jgi:hypothetical protein